MYNTSGNSCRDLPVLLETAALSHHLYLHDDVRLVLILHNLASAAASKEDALI